MAVLNRDAWTCVYCGKHLEGSDATADHIVALVNGGTDDAFNLVAACRTCNGTKSDKELVRTFYLNQRWLTELPR